jgi:hypothetical protein
MSIVHVPAVYRYRTEAEIAAEAAQPTTTVAPEPLEPALDLDGALSRLDAELQKLDELAARDREFPGTIAGIESKLTELESQDLDTLPALEARSAQVGKYTNMRSLAASQAKKTKAAIAQQQAIVLKTGTQAASLAEQFWWTLRTAAATQAEAEFSRLFYHAFESLEVLNRFKPVTLLERLKVPELRAGAADVKLTRCRQLRGSVDRLREFSTMSFEEVAAELEAQDSEARSRAQQVRQIGSEQV